MTVSGEKEILAAGWQLLRSGGRSHAREVVQVGKVIDVSSVRGECL